MYSLSEKSLKGVVVSIGLNSKSAGLENGNGRGKRNMEN